MPKKILICEDNDKIAELIADSCKRRGYEPVVALVEEKKCTKSYIERIIQAAVSKEQPDYFIVDGLSGGYDCAIETAKRAKPNILSVVFAGDKDLITEARNKGYAAYQKPDGIREVFEFIRKKDN